MYFQDKTLAAHMARADVVVFDMNGTIVDDEPLHKVASNVILGRYGIILDDADFMARCVGRKPKEWLTEVLQDNPVDEAEIDFLVVERDEIYADLIQSRVKELARPGVIDLIHWISAHPDKKLALATSNTRRGMEIILGPSGLDVFSLFNFVVTGDEVKKAKPDPAIYLRVRDEFPGAAHFLAFEDTGTGVKAAAAADMVCIAIPSDFTKTHDFTPARLVIGDFLA